MTEPTNVIRVGWAYAALDAFGACTGQVGYAYDDPEVFEEIAGDLVGDLFHAALAAGVDPDRLVELGRFHHDAEVDEEAP